MGSRDDDEVVWPPVVVISNVPTWTDPETKKYRGMESKEILADMAEMIQGVEYRRLIPIYNYRGQTSRAFLVFPSTHQGYDNAVKVHKAFADRRKANDGRLTGYLAVRRDMESLDFKKKTFKWKIESMEELVLKPRRKSIREYEDKRKLQMEIQQTSDAFESAIDGEAQMAASLQDMLARKKEEADTETRLQSEIHSQHDLEMKRLRLKREADREVVLRKIRKENAELNDSMKRKRHETNAEILKFRQEGKLLKDGIYSRQKMFQESEWLLNEQNLNLKIEELIAPIKAEQHRRMMELRQKFNEERMQLAKVKQEKEKAMLEDLVQKKEQLTETTSSSCIICMETFTAALRRALYECGHSHVCEECLPVVWKARKECPICRRKQNKMPILTHVFA